MTVIPTLSRHPGEAAAPARAGSPPARLPRTPRQRGRDACAVPLLAALVAAFGVALASPVRLEVPPAGRVVLLPIDDRPAVAQFAQMIGAIADCEVVIPPPPMLGRFTRPGDTAALQQWLRRQDYSKVDALVVSVDMLAYGGLIASRTHKVTTERALDSLEFFRWFKREHPGIPVYAFSVLMRVAPTADAASRSWGEDLARWSELKDRAARTADASLQAELERTERRLPPAVMEDYLAARKRDLAVNLAAIDLRSRKQIDTLILLQDDARLYGLHRLDQRVISSRLKELGLESEVPVYNGADEGSLALVSRAVLVKSRAPVNVFAVYSSARARKVTAPFEDRPLEFTVANQLRGSGATPVDTEEASDYRLYVNAPETTEAEFEVFVDAMTRDMKSGRPVALADVLFPAPHHSGADQRVIRRLEEQDLFDRFTGYAAWNTAGNTLGTAIPHANMRILAIRKFASDPERAARTLVAHLEFLLHRFAGDYLYHDVVRFEINGRLRKQAGADTNEFTPAVHGQVNAETVGKLRPLVMELFDRRFKGRDYGSVRITGLRDLDIVLPWPRTFEVTIRYRMEYELRHGPRR